jgi:hypothetical protein
MKNLEIQKIENEMKALYNAMKSKDLSVNDYCTMHWNLAQKLNKLKSN